tara:strand:- start:725 stop:1006 length:282 start_codon:yes stop_codon:yes gene_type:complete
MTKVLIQHVEQIINEVPYIAHFDYPKGVINPNPWEDLAWVALISQHLQECLLLPSMGMDDEITTAQAIGCLQQLKAKYPQLCFDSRVEKMVAS